MLDSNVCFQLIRAEDGNRTRAVVVRATKLLELLDRPDVINPQDFVAVFSFHDQALDPNYFSMFPLMRVETFIAQFNKIFDEQMKPYFTEMEDLV